MDRSLILLLILSFFLGVGCWLFFIWGVKKGEFDDMERPKHRMMDDNDVPGKAVPSSKLQVPGSEFSEGK